MNNFVKNWIRPYALYIFPWFIVVSVILTSYSMYESKQQGINELRNSLANAQKATYDPYEQPLLTGIAYIDIIIGSKDKNIGTNHFNSWCYRGRILLVKEQESFLEMWIATMPGIHIERIENNQLRYSGELALKPDNKTTGKPISYLTKADSALIYIFDNIPQDSNIISGKTIITLNSSVRIEIPIPSQIMDGNAIVIEDIQKYFKKGN